MVRIFVITFALLSMAIFTCCSQKGSIQKSSNINLNSQFIFWNIGQGDMMTYVSKHYCIFFDTGGNKILNSIALNFLRNHCFLKNNILFISHYDKDHIVKYILINKLLNLSQVYVPHLNPQTKTGKKFLEYFKKMHVSVKTCLPGFEKYFDLLKVKLLSHDHDKSENSKSLLLLLKQNKRTLLLTGDLQSTFEPHIDIQIDILKVGHHGSKYSSSQSFLKHIKPKACIISVGKNNYGHPAPEVLMRLQSAKCSILRTDVLGNIKLNL